MDFIEPCFGIGHNLSLICQMTSEDIKHQLIITITTIILVIVFYVIRSGTSAGDDRPHQVPGCIARPVCARGRRLPRDEHRRHQEGAGGIAAQLLHLRLHGCSVQRLLPDGRGPSAYSAKAEPGKNNNNNKTATRFFLGLTSASA